MRKAAQKIVRDGFEFKVTNIYRAMYPHFQFEYHARRLPLFPKIILYSSVPGVERLTSRLFPSFKTINPKLQNESDQNLAKQVATQIINRTEQQIQSPGVIINGFPLNPTQALLLDRLVDGVNLVLHVKGGSVASEMTPLLNYYDERGTLFEFEYKDNLSEAEFERLSVKVKLSMKSAN